MDHDSGGHIKFTVTLTPLFSPPNLPEQIPEKCISHTTMNSKNAKYLKEATPKRVNFWQIRRGETKNNNFTLKAHSAVFPERIGLR